MSISQYTHTPGAVATHISTQGKFLFYKRASSGVANTDVGVTVGGQFLGLISPTEHIRLNTAFDNLILTPVDTANAALFVIADYDEEFGTSQVAGSVQVTNFPAGFNVNNFPSGFNVNNVAVFNFDKYATDSGKGIAKKGGVGASTNAIETFYIINPTGSTKTLYIDSVISSVKDRVTGGIVQSRLYCNLLTHTYNSTITYKPTYTDGSGPAPYGDAGSVILTGIVYLDSTSESFSLDSAAAKLKCPFKVAPGYGLEVLIEKLQNNANSCDFSYSYFGYE